MSPGPEAPVVVVDAIAAGAALDADSIREALRHRKSMERESDFLGRNTTQVFADAQTVVKIRPDLEIPFRENDPMGDRAIWIGARLERERAIRGYPSNRK